LAVLQSGFEETIGIKGSSTAVVCAVDKSELCVINVGDSGCYVVREQKV
jgi:serine/threonine protein phosphatase PrpC